MEGKKISFGFMKTKKADKPLAHNNDERKDYIECVEEQSIKIVGGEDVPVNEPLVIPLKPNTLMKPDRLKEIALKIESALVEPSIEQDVTMADPVAENLTLDQMAERELLQEAKKDVVVENPTMAIPTSSKGVAEGETESTLDDYEAVPVQEFGVAMLRGMGWKPGQSSSTYKQPELRPKGLGLGAHKVIKAKPKVTKDGKQEELAILKNSFVKITAGKYADFYGKVVSLDEENGRVMVDIPLKKETVSLSEFMMHVVTKSEYDRESKVIRKHKRLHMSVDDKQEIIAMHEKKIPIIDIARRLNIARNTVYLWIKRWEKEGVLKARLRSGRPRKLTPHKEASLYEDIAHKTNLNMSDLAANHGVSIATIRRHTNYKGSENKNEEQMDENETDSVTNIIDDIVVADIDNEEESKRMTLERKRKRIIELHQQKYKISAIAKRLNITRQAVVLCIKCWRLQKSDKACVTIKPVEKKDITKKKILRTSPQSDSDTDHEEFTTISSRTRDNNKRPRRKIRDIEIKNDTKLHKKRTVRENVETKEERNVSQSSNKQLSKMQKENIIAMYKLKQPIAVIARRLKITRKTADMWIKRWRREGALKRQTSRGRPPKLTAKDEATLIEEASKQAEDINLSDLASNHGVSEATVRRCLKQHGINFKQKRRGGIRGAYKPRANDIICSDNEFEETEEKSRTGLHLSADRKIKILTLYEQKHSISAIARHLKVSKNTVRMWVRRWQGEGTIEAHAPSGRPRKLTVDAEAILKAQVLEGGPLQVTNLATSHGVSTATIRRCLRANGLDTKLKGNQDCSNLQNSVQDFDCNTLTELDCENDTSQDEDQNLDANTVVTKMVCDRGTSLDPRTLTAPAELENNTVSDGLQDLCSGTVVTKIVCDRGTSPDDFGNE